MTGIQTIITKGSGYFVGNAVSLSGGDGTATAFVNNVDAQGGVLTLTVANTGTSGYVTGQTMSAPALGRGRFFAQITNGLVQGAGCQFTVTASANQQAVVTPLMGLTSVSILGGSYAPLNLPSALVNGNSGYISLTYGVLRITMLQTLVTSTPASISITGAGSGAVAQLNGTNNGTTTYSMGTPNISNAGLAFALANSNNTSIAHFTGGGGTGAQGTARWNNTDGVNGYRNITLVSIDMSTYPSNPPVFSGNGPGSGYVLNSNVTITIDLPPGFQWSGGLNPNIATATPTFVNPVGVPPTQYTYPAGPGTITMSNYGTGYNASTSVLINGNSTYAAVTVMTVTGNTVVSPEAGQPFPPWHSRKRGRR